MNRLARLALGAFALCAGCPALATPAVADKMWRLDCGTMRANDMDAFSDTMAYRGRKLDFIDSCYVIKHGTAYMLWDTGVPAGLKGAALNSTDTFTATLKTTIIEQLARIGITLEQITVVGISHYHFDHTGQAASFPRAKLMIGKRDVDALNAGATGADKTPLTPWFGGGAMLVPVSGDKDVFGDGSVTMVDLPGHTPGHHGLLVQLARTGPVLLSGDVAHLRENLDTNGVPGFNTSRAESLASMDRYRKLATTLHAIAIVQHDPRDVAKLPAFPSAAE